MVNYLQLSHIYDLLNAVNIAEPYKVSPGCTLKDCLAIFPLSIKTN